MGTGTVPEAPEFRIQLSDEDGRVEVAVEGELDIATADEFLAVVTAQLDRGPVRLDLSALVFMDSSGVRALDTLMRTVGQKGAELSISPELQDPVRQILDVTQMLAALPFADAP